MPTRSRSPWLGLLLLLHCFPVTLTFTLRIIHTNDVHARFNQTNVRSGPCTDENAANGECYGGYARLVYEVNRLRSQDPNHTLVLDAGDQYTGTPWFQMFGGNLTALAENLLQYDLSTLGNHEFDKGVDGLLPFLQNVHHPILCANLDLTNEPRMKPFINNSIVLSRGGMRIGVIGFITSDTGSISNAGNHVVFLDEKAAVQREVQRLKAEGVKVIIGLSHAGLEKDRQLAREVDGLDVIVGGHSHSFLWTGTPPSTERPVAEYPVVVENPSGYPTLVVQAYAYSKYLGFIQVEFDAEGNVMNWTGAPILLNNSIPQDGATLQALAPYSALVAQLRGMVRGDSHVFLQGSETVCRKQECTMGNVVADAYLWWWQNLTTPTDTAWTNVSIAVTNGGGVRTSILQGPITREEVISVLPFDNYLDTIDMHGSDVKLMFEKSASVLNMEKSSDLFGGFLQVAGARVTYDVSKEVGQRVVELLLLCAQCREPVFEPVQDGRLYRIAIPDFTANGGDGYDIIKTKQTNRQTSGVRVSDILESYLQGHWPIYTGIESRITIRYPTSVTSAAWRSRETTPFLLVAAVLAAILAREPSLSSVC